MKSIANLAAVLFLSCTMNACAQANSDNASVQQSQDIAQIDPEDNAELVGTNVLGFKLRHSTIDSVKKRLKNYETRQHDLSFASNPILENNGSGFDIEGLVGTQFAFDKEQKLAFVGMTIQEADPMSHTTYKKIVSYIANNGYKIVHEEKPFVGDQRTEFITPNKETIEVFALHLGGFKVHVEYATDEFRQALQNAKAEQGEKKTKSEAKNF